jgi:3,4-dihydroxy 2-butanone 4-phosphate synthase/GTP cyclohydrolase II
MKEDGSMARVPDLIEFCRVHGLKMHTVAELIRYRLRNERYIQRTGETTISTRFGDFRFGEEAVGQFLRIQLHLA